MPRSPGASIGARRCGRASAASPRTRIPPGASRSRCSSSDGVKSGAVNDTLSAALSARVSAQFAESAQLKLEAARSLTAPIARASALLAETLKRGGKVLACGNGGSAADAQHFAAELINRFEIERAPLAAVALTNENTHTSSDYHHHPSHNTTYTNKLD